MPGSSQERVSRLLPRNDKNGCMLGSQQRHGKGEKPAGEKLRYRRSSLFTSIENYRKCLASTYQGWGLQSLVSEREKNEKGRERETEISECVVFFSLSHV